MLEVLKVSRNYSKPGSFLGKKDQAILKDISFNVNKGECVGLVGESGSGKSTLSRLVLGLDKPASGKILFSGQPVKKWKKKNPGQMSVVFQDYTSSVNQRFTVVMAISEPLRVKMNGFSRTDIEKKVKSLLDRVELSSNLMNNYPHELSGGQLQRVCIARAIATKPSFILFDEALSSLDISVQAQVLDLLSDLKRELSLTYLFIAHDLMAVTSICDRILFLNQGTIVEKIKTEELSSVKNEYVKKLLVSAAMFSGK